MRLRDGEANGANLSSTCLHCKKGFLQPCQNIPMAPVKVAAREYHLQTQVSFSKLQAQASPPIFFFPILSVPLVLPAQLMANHLHRCQDRSQGVESDASPVPALPGELIGPAGMCSHSSSSQATRNGKKRRRSERSSRPRVRRHIVASGLPPRS